MSKVYLSDEICAEARDKMRELMHAEDSKGDWVQHRAADALMRACLTQQRYRLHPQTPDDYERAAKRIGSGAKALEEMTPEELLAYQREMLGDDYPGKPS